jgi:quercetin dioxygenase-like cupin family protein
MPIFNAKSIIDAPDWVKVSNYGVSIMKKGQTVEPHYHDCDEFWYIVSGKARVRTEGNEYIVQQGDVVCTKMGDDHELIEILEDDYVVVWIETELKGQKRIGHLHR